MSERLTSKDTYTLYFKEDYKTYTSFFISCIKTKRIPSEKIGTKTYVYKKDTLEFIKKNNSLAKDKTYWIQILEELFEEKMISKATSILGLNNPTSLYLCRKNGTIGSKLLIKLNLNKKELLGLLKPKKSRLIKKDVLPQDVKAIKSMNTNNPYGFSHVQIADKLGMTRGEVWQLEEKALTKIRKVIIESNFSPTLMEYFEA